MKPNQIIAESWRVHLQVVWGREPKPASWRRKLGRLLRGMADRLDARRSWAAALHTEPPLSSEAVKDCFKQGAIAIEAAALAECRLEAQERILQRSEPKLFAR